MLTSFFIQNKTYYLDAAATTPVSDRAMRAMRPYWNHDFYNPNAIYSSALKVRDHLAKISTQTLHLLNARKDDEIVWTRGGTESNQLAIDAVITQWSKTHSKETATIITSAIEHASISDFLKYKQYPHVKWVKAPVDTSGKIDLIKYEELLETAENVIMVSIVFQSSEIGRIQPIKEIAQLTRSVSLKNGTNVPVIHTDMSQGLYTHMPNTQNLGIDMLTLCAQKIEGPKGVGALYVSQAYKKLIPKGGTPPTALICGMYAQLEYLAAHRDTYTTYVENTRAMFFSSLDKVQIAYECNGYKEELSHIINITLVDYAKDSESLIVACDQLHLEVSSKSACMGSQKEDSRVLNAMGLNRESSLRISFIPTINKGLLSEQDTDEIARRIKTLVSP